MVSTSYRPELDGIRAICIIFTVCNHIHGTPRFIDGSVGVDIFFALSGWLITWLLLVEGLTCQCTDLRGFYIRRVFRIMPLYYLTLLLYFCAALTMTIAKRGGNDLADFQRVFVYLVTFNSEYRPSGTIFGQAWTLGIEEKFYILWPLALVVWRRAPLTIVALGLATTILLTLQSPIPTFQIRGYVGLGAGAAMAVCAFRSARFRCVLNFAAPWSLLALVGSYALVLMGGRAFNVLLSVSGAFLVASVWFRRDQFIAKVLATTPLAYVGRLTYAVYLTHVLVINALEVMFGSLLLPWSVKVLIAYAGSLAVAAFLHKTVEKYFIAIGKRLAIRSRIIQQEAMSTPS
ncbi:MAG TPA: acyltransferase [Methylophilaceae bacterium]|jgi:peptidoglycan/LPS O-acetylase OafA/YrhL